MDRTLLYGILYKFIIIPIIYWFGFQTVCGFIFLLLFYGATTRLAPLCGM